MTPKDKAMEIAMKYDKYGETDNAVKCALICVDEILKNEVNTTMHPNDSIMDYWKEVKKEIEKS